MATLQTLFEQFLRERRYLKNVSPKTRVWYETAWKTFLATQPAGVATAELNGAPPITRQHLHVFVVALRDRGVRPATVNTWLRALNAFCRWLHEEGVLREPTKLKPLKLKRRFVKTLDDAALKAVLTFKPKGYSQWRVHAAVSTILDTGCLIDEVLSARVRDFDFHNLLLTVVGKGDKQRIVPFSFELRKLLIRFGKVREQHVASTLITTNRPTQDWGVFLGDVPAATAILDRFLAHAIIVQMTGKSYRLRQRTSGADD